MPLRFKVLAVFNFLVGVMMIPQSTVLLLNSFKEAPAVIVFTVMCFIGSVAVLIKNPLNDRNKKILSLLPIIIIILYFGISLIIN